MLTVPPTTEVPKIEVIGSIHGRVLCIRFPFLIPAGAWDAGRNFQNHIRPRCLEVKLFDQTPKSTNRRGVDAVLVGR